MNNGGVVTRKATQTKLSFSSVHCFRSSRCSDRPRPTPCLPHQIANGLVDAYVHVMEQYLTSPVQARPQDRFAEGLLQTWWKLPPARWPSRPTTTTAPT